MHGEEVVLRHKWFMSTESKHIITYAHKHRQIKYNAQINVNSTVVVGATHMRRNVTRILFNARQIVSATMLHYVQGVQVSRAKTRLGAVGGRRSIYSILTYRTLFCFWS